MLLSAAIAAFGLVNDSAAVVIGAMLVAPLMTPILAVAAAIVHGWGRRALESLLIVGAGALTGIGVGIAVGLLPPSLRTGLPLPGELLARTGPNLVDLFIALAAGAAAGFQHLAAGGVAGVVMKQFFQCAGLVVQPDGLRSIVAMDVGMAHVRSPLSG